MVVIEYEDIFPYSISYEPWLILLHGRHNDKKEFINPYNHRIEERKIQQLDNKLFLGCFGEWLLLSEKSTTKTYFLNFSLDPKLTVHLPLFDNDKGILEYQVNCVVSNSPTSRKCMVTFVGRRRNCILYYRPNMDSSWSKVPISIDSDDNCFSGQIVRSKGKIYTLYSCGDAYRVVVINESSLLMGHSEWKMIDVPCVIDPGSLRHLVVSGEKIFFVLVTICCNRGNPTNCSIFLLEISDLSWKRVRSIGGRVFFLGGIQNAALSAKQAGMQCDCIFIVNAASSYFSDEGIYKICLWDQTVSLTLPLKWPKYISWQKLCWVMPTRFRKNNQRTLSLSHDVGTNMGFSTSVHNEQKKEESCKIDNSRTWTDMPIELMQLILSRLNLVDCVRLASLCKAWNSLSNLIQDSMVNPWLIYSVHESSSWRMFEPVFEGDYSLDMRWLRFSGVLTFLYSKDGWILTSKEDDSLFLINLITREFVSLPKLNVGCTSFKQTLHLLTK